MGGSATRYLNGQVPRSALIRIASGTNGDGYWEHLLSPAQKRKHDALVARAKRHRGRTLRITSGWNGYRPIDAQWVAKRKYGSGAAAPGFSSHGGTYKGRDAMAMDYGNWSWVYNGDRNAFFADCRAVGLTPGVIWNESWHVIDYDPWAPVPAALPADEFEPVVVPEEDEDDMMFKPTVHARTNGKGDADEWMLGHPGIGVDLPVFEGTATSENSRLTADKSVKVFRGFMVTVDRDVFTAWARTYAKGTGEITSSTDRAGYIAIQKQLSRVSDELI